MRIHFILIAVLALPLTLHADAQGRLPDRTAGRQKPTGARLSAPQKDNLKQLKSDLDSIKKGSQVTDAMKQSLANSLMAVADGAVKPSEESVTKLSTDLTTALQDGEINQADKATLAADLKAVLRSANIPEAEGQAAIQSAKALLTAANISPDEVNAVITDLKAIQTELQKNVQAGKSKVKGRLGSTRARPGK